MILNDLILKEDKRTLELGRVSRFILNQLVFLMQTDITEKQRKNTTQAYVPCSQKRDRCQVKPAQLTASENSWELAMTNWARSDSSQKKEDWPQSTAELFPELSQKMKLHKGKKKQGKRIRGLGCHG
ncbi:hypothetical protein RRG08_024883 [Elysia crispata]|uniref:Uncharacterized protein n=1 Tax=Elysia crispata TaxID=231223 RepID=A0AAE0YKX9_9GAST|nr:hypothetical protein RRG08_024883 [Elysia crispata]